MRLAFYKGGKGIKGRKRFITKLVQFFTRGIYAHVEIDFGKGYKQNCFSSSGMDKPRGVRFKKISFSHKERWDFIEIKRVNEIFLRKECKKYVGKKYDYRGVINFFWLKRKRHNPKRWFCSEICSHLLGIKPAQISPSKMYKIAKKMYNI